MTGSALVKWNMPDGTPVTFQDVRPGANTPEPDNSDTLAVTFEIITKALAETPGHEGRHAAVGMLLDFKTVKAQAALPAEDGILGCVTFDYSGETWDRMRLAEDAVVLLAGPIGDKAGPPAWPPRSDDGMAGYSDEKALAEIVRRLDLNEKQYDGLVDIARTITRNPGIKRVADRIETLLNCGLVLTSRMLEDIHDAAWRETAEEAQAEAERNRSRTPAEIEDAELREQHRQWMTGVLDDGITYHQQRAEEQAARDLRRRAMQLAAEVEQTTTKHHGGSRRTSVFPAAFTTH
jgi:hypothetical protein